MSTSSQSLLAKVLRLILICTLLVLISSPQSVHSAKILSVTFVTSKSSKITYEPLLYELAKRGHQVTILGPFPSGKVIPNVREIDTIDVESYLSRMPNMFNVRQSGGVTGMNPRLMLDQFAAMCRDTFDVPAVQQLLKRREQFDLVFLPSIFNDCAAGYVHKFNTTLILTSPVTSPSWITSVFGSPSPPSFVPNLFAGLDDRMSFYERTVNFLVEGALRGLQAFMFQPSMASIYREKLNDPSLPDVETIYKNASLILSNSHFSLSKSRPFLPDIVEVGGMHCMPAKPLPKDLAAFVDSSGSDGFIFFSMGTALKGSTMPEKYRQLFLRVFAKLKQKVLWKWETEQMDGLPSNVKLSKWLPQQDVLGHPKIKAFITHGGFGGTTEAIYHGVPLVGIPMFGDQHLNMKKSVGAGFAVSLEFTTMTEDELLAAINRVLTEPTFRDRAQYLSKVFRDQPDQPMDRAIFWTEYVIRHKGALHLRSAARELNFIQYHSIDVIATLIVILWLTLYVVFAVLRFIVRKTCCRSEKKVVSRGKKKN